MSKYQALIDAPSLHDQIMNIQCDRATLDWANTREAYQYGHRDARHAAAELAQAQDATIRALLADLEVAEKALREVIAVFDSNPSSICDTVWITGNRPETLYDHCQEALAQMAGW